MISLSLGGAIGAAVGKNHPEVSYINDRSFSDMPTAIRSLFWIPIFSDFIAWLMQPYWNLSTVENIQQIQGHRSLIVADQDFVIDFEETSLYSALARLQIHLPTHHISREIEQEQPLLNRAYDYAMVHCYDLPSLAFYRLIYKWLEDHTPPKTPPSTPITPGLDETALRV